MQTKPNILIVDDVKMNIALLEVVLKKVNINLIAAESGVEALEKVEGVELALAILDVSMPDMNGYELAMRLNEDKVPVIFLTANCIDELAIFEGYDSGAVDYIIKPFKNKILVSKVNVFVDLFIQKHTALNNARLLKLSADKLSETNDALKRSEEKYRSYIDYAPDGVFVTDKIGKFVEVNKATCELTGYSKEELLQKLFSDILSESSLNLDVSKLMNIEGSQTNKADLLVANKNGSCRWWVIEVVRLDEKHLLWFTKDINDRKKAEEDLKSSLHQLHQLTKYIEKVRESERVAIARDLHDDLGQALTAVKIDLGIIRKNISDPVAGLKIEKVSSLVKDTILTVQRITSQLRPQIIDDLGLEAAIEWYTKDFSLRNNIDIFLDMDSDLSISPEASLIVFRIMQESLTNISRHSKANRIDIGLLKTGEAIFFTISDNGIGISEEEINAKNSFGIIGMKERAAAMEGTFEMRRGKTGGTTIKIIIPFNKISSYENSDL
jgi:two-component system sensor histidine kinase UhpB